MFPSEDLLLLQSLADLEKELCNGACSSGEVAPGRGVFMLLSVRLKDLDTTAAKIRPAGIRVLPSLDPNWDETTKPNSPLTMILAAISTAS